MPGGGGVVSSDSILCLPTLILPSLWGLSDGGGYLQPAGAAFQGWVLNIPEELSANYCLAQPRPGPPGSPELPGLGQRTLVALFLGHTERPRDGPALSQQSQGAGAQALVTPSMQARGRSSRGLGAEPPRSVWGGGEVNWSRTPT